MTSATERLIEAATQCLDKESDCQGECASVFPETCWWRNLKEAIAALELEQPASADATAKLIPFQPDAEPAKGQGQCLYDRYRDERSRQGWAEFPWEKLTDTQQLVWHRLVAAIKAGEVRP